MQIDVSSVIKNLNDKPIKMDPEGKDEPENHLTLKTVLINGLMFIDEKNVSGKEKVDRYQLAMKINRADGVIDLTPENVTKLRDLIGKAYPSPVVVGQAWELLDPPKNTDSKPTATKKKK